METQEERKLSKNAERAASIKEQFSDDIRIAAEAMKRTIRHRKTQVVSPKKYSYRQIF